jgi:hypothetical protein
MWTGGFVVDLGLFRIRSRTPGNVIVIAILSAALAWVVAPPGHRGRTLAAAWNAILRGLARPFRDVRGLALRLAPVLAGLTAVAVVALGFWKGALVAGGADSYGYVSQAHLWRTGIPRVEQPIMSAVSWPYSEMSLAPLGYRPAPTGPAIVPVYAPGLPIVMAIFERLGGRQAVFYVVPVLGGVAVWATYLMGATVAGPMVGLAAAVLLATSPVFLYQLMFPMSDVPVTAWWALCLVALPFKRRDCALAAGLAAGIALLTRPNLVPLLAVPGIFLLRAVVNERSPKGQAAQRLVLFTAGVIPACIVVAYLNVQWYGGIFNTGYGSLDYLYGPENLWTNATHYSRWLLDSQTPAILLAVAAPFVLARGDADSRRYGARAVVVTWFLFMVAVAACYAFYAPFEAWWFLRFLLPAFPALFVLTSIGLIGLATRLARDAGGLVAAVLIALLARHGVQFANDRAAFTFREGERKYVAVGDYIAHRLPDRAVLICVQHSGSIRYYSGRLTVRFDLITENRLDTVIEQLRNLGYHPYLVLEQGELRQFQKRFQGHSELAALDWTPTARLQHASDVRIYDPADQRLDAEHQPVTETIE